MASAKARGKLPEVIDLTDRPSAFQPNAGVKKLVIKNFRKSSAQTAQVERYYAKTEEELDETLEAIFASKKPALPLERVYRGVEDMCRRGNAVTVYRMLVKRIEGHLQKTVLPRIRRSGTTSSLEMLKNVLVEWKTWNTQTVRLTTCYLLQKGLLC